MKKILLIAALSFTFCVDSTSQVTKGSWLVGGNVGFSMSRYGGVASGSNTYTLQIQPKGGIFLFNKFAAGAHVDWSFYKHESESTSASVGPFVRYYFLPAESKVNLFGEAAYRYGS